MPSFALEPIEINEYCGFIRTSSVSSASSLPVCSPDLFFRSVNNHYYESLFFYLNNVDVTHPTTHEFIGFSTNGIVFIMPDNVPD